MCIICLIWTLLIFMSCYKSAQIGFVEDNWHNLYTTNSDHPHTVLQSYSTRGQNAPVQTNISANSETLWPVPDCTCKLASLLSSVQQSTSYLRQELAVWQANLMQQSIRIYSLHVSHKQLQLFLGEAAAPQEAVQDIHVERQRTLSTAPNTKFRESTSTRLCLWQRL